MHSAPSDMIPAPVEITVILLLGLAFGSFANVCIHRWPRGESTVVPPSHCPNCGTLIRWYDNVPVLSYLVLRGRCRICDSGIHWRYPAMEAGMAALLLLPWFFTDNYWEMGALAVLFFCLLIGAAIDQEFGILPNRITLGGLLAGLCFAVPRLDFSVVDALIGAAASMAVLAGFRWLGGLVLKRESMGLGDVKLAGMIGAFLGWQLGLVALYIGFVAALVILLPAWILSGFRRAVRIKMGPFLAAGAVIGALQGAVLLDWLINH